MRSVLSVGKSFLMINRNTLCPLSNDTESCFTLSTDEYIVSVLVKAGAIIDAVQFTSSLGNTYGPYGGVGGTPYTVSGPDFEALLKMEVVAGAWRDGTYITQMRFYFDDRMYTIPFYKMLRFLQRVMPLRDCKPCHEVEGHSKSTPQFTSLFIPYLIDNRVFIGPAHSD